MEWIVENQVMVFSLLGILVFILSIYLGFIYSQVKRQNQKLLKKDQEREKYIKESVYIISQATLQGQCDLSECCIRLKNLLDYFPASSTRPDYAAIYAMYEEIKKFPTHEARNSQSKKQIFGQDSERYRIEDKYKDRLYKALAILQAEFKS